MTLDFLIIGAGPSGLFLSYLLAKKNYHVAVIDKLPKIKRKICGEYLCPMGVELFRRNHLSELIENHFQEIQGMNLYSPRGVIVDTDFPKIGGIQKGAALNRHDFDQLLYELAKKEGVKIFMDHPLEHIEKNDSTWSITSGDKNFIAKYVVGADGRGSRLASMLNVQREYNMERIALHCYLKPKINNIRKGEMHIFDDGSYIGVDPISEEESNFSLVCNKSDIKKHENLFEVLNHYIEKSEYLKSKYHLLTKETEVFSVCPINNYISKTVGESWALIGDASGFIDPLTGEGIYNALLTAELLAKEISIYPEDIQKAFNKYASHRKSLLREKSRLNYFFQWFIRRTFLIEVFARFLNRKKKRGDLFIGIIGNIYTPIKGIVKIIFA